ncbi:spore germination protein GerPC [Ornithinibacillus halophilus]|uniref:Spore germination protein PC n=1 Tax=Ornithinibacillus halophilus TaxID=930117 RepID=A0A1M5I212_9BACI|nr:spore germination protein GerPC [Ornithinibacillus halophilus]SHG22187.1 spore germination protein PC [Ornithinibacillus halophilus]
MSMYDWNNYLYELNQSNQYLLQKIQELENRINEMEEKLEENKSTNIEKIEYKFDQLKVEHLEGTLHVGLSPSDLANIEDLGLGQQNSAFSNPIHKIPPVPPAAGRHPSLINRLNKYLHEDGPKLIQNLAKKNNHPVDSDFEKLLIQDMEKQLPQRIQFYETRAHDQKIPNNNVPNYIFEHIQKEVTHSIETYMKNNNGGEGDHQ